MQYRPTTRLRLLAGLLILSLTTMAPRFVIGADPASDTKKPAVEPTPPPNKDAAADQDKGAEPKAEKHSARDEEEFYDLYKALADTVDQVDRNYVKKVDRRELMEAAIKGVLSKLDPYSSYIGPADAGHFKDTVENQFGGIGIQITIDDGQLRILSPLVGTPGYKAGLLAGDKILKIDNDNTANLDIEEVVHKLKGDAGSSVKLTIVHPGSAKQETVSVTREVIHIDTVLGDRRKADDSWDFMLDADKHIGYIRITTFSRDTAQDLKKAMDDLRHRKLRGLIVDLRFNPGGLLTTAIETCDMFLNEGRIVSTEGRNTPKRVWDATKKNDAFTGFPIAILVNRYSASASEIVSACLQDHGRAMVVGERSWGKGSVQNLIELEDGKSLLKLTTASYQRPNGHNIHRFPDSKETDEWGVSPNPGFEIKLSDTETAQVMNDRRARDIIAGKHGAAEKPATSDNGKEAKHVVDRQMQKAIDYLATELARAP